MEWFHVFGLVIVTLIMIPNVLFAIKCKGEYANRWNHRTVEWMEQIGRICCFCLMIFNIPGTCFPWQAGYAVEIAVNALLTALYLAVWVICWKRNSVFRALALSILPSVLFLFSGVIRGSVLLIASALLFAPSHILISYKNAKA